MKEMETMQRGDADDDDTDNEILSRELVNLQLCFEECKRRMSLRSDSDDGGGEGVAVLGRKTVKVEILIPANGGGRDVYRTGGRRFNSDNEWQ
jgi:hypothetical protein